MKQFPKRGPRVLHGMASMVAAAANASLNLAAQRASGSAVPSSEAEAMRDLDTLVNRLRVAELREAVARKHLLEYRKQAQALPEDHAARKVTEMIVDNVLTAMGEVK